jgi:hypothetical protein
MRHQRLRAPLQKRRNRHAVDVVGAHVEARQRCAHGGIDSAGGDELRHVQAGSAGIKLDFETERVVIAARLGLEEAAMLRLRQPVEAVDELVDRASGVGNSKAGDHKRAQGQRAQALVV